MADRTGVTATGSSSQTSRTSTDAPDESLTGRVREQATSQLNTQKNKATDGLGTVASAVRKTTDQLRSENHDTVARYAEQAADQIERLSERIRRKDVGELLNDAQRLARQRPALFVGGAFAVGLLGARFMKSSAESGDDYSSSSGLNRDWRQSSPDTNAYGNRVPSRASSASVGSSSARTSSAPSPRTAGGARSTAERDYPPTEGL
jgi:hypothetical protein